RSDQNLQISIFIGHTLECKKSKINQVHEIIKKNKIDGLSLSKLSKTDLMSIFDFETFSQACNIHDSFNEICKKYPINVIYSNKSAKHVIPKEYLCPLSNLIMEDPVIALNGITYDRSSIMNQYKNIPNYSSLMTNGNLELFPDYALRQNIQNFLKNPKWCLSFVCNFYFFKKGYICKKSFQIIVDIKKEDKNNRQ
ncbi:WD repeat, SAM and U-box domain-containing protein 1, partial [Reticulomyxa filosa]